jgi:integrase
MGRRGGRDQPQDVRGHPQHPDGGRTTPHLCRAHKLQTGRHGHELFLGRTPVDPFYTSTVRARALKAWGCKQTRNPASGGPKTIWVKAGPDALEPPTPHEARHCAGSYMIAAAMDQKKIEFLGHSDVRSTYNRYGKVVPEDSRLTSRDQERQAAALRSF